MCARGPDTLVEPRSVPGWVKTSNAEQDLQFLAMGTGDFLLRPRSRGANQTWKLVVVRRGPLLLVSGGEERRLESMDGVVLPPNLEVEWVQGDLPRTSLLAWGWRLPPRPALCRGAN